MIVYGAYIIVVLSTNRSTVVQAVDFFRSNSKTIHLILPDRCKSLTINRRSLLTNNRKYIDKLVFVIILFIGYEVIVDATF